MSKTRLNCENCGKFFYRYPSQITENTKYCSMECKSKNKTVELKCETCDRRYRRCISNYEKHGSSFCSRECQNKAELETLTCESCGEEFEKLVSQMDASGRSHCSWECRYIDSEWEEKYGDNWRKQRKKAIERDSYECQSCGISQTKCRNENYSGLHTHHKTPFQQFDDYEDANELENLITLCPPCHWNAERG